METTLENAVTIAIVGFSIVLLTLAGFAVIISVINKLNTIIVKKITNKKIPTPKISQSDNSEYEDILPVILAAASATLGEKVRIRNISFVSDMHSHTAWSQLSISSNFDAHNIIQNRRTRYGER